MTWLRMDVLSGVFGEAQLVLRRVSHFFQIAHRHKDQRTVRLVVGKVSEGKRLAMFEVLSRAGE